MKIRNLFLMLKQGIKGVFKFRIQFIIIVLLAFVASFILSVSLSTQKKINESYETIVEPEGEFSYSGGERISSSVNATSDPLLLPNLISNTGTTAFKIIDKDGTVVRKTSGYNFVYDNFNGKYKDEDKQTYVSFLTKGTEKFIQKAKADASFADASFKDNGTFILYDLYLKSFFFELNEISTLSINKMPISKISKTMKGSQTIYSSVGLFTYNNPFWYSQFLDSEGNPQFDGDIVDWKDNTDIYKATMYGLAELVELLSKNVMAFNKDNTDKFQITTNGQAIAFLFGELTSDNVKSELPADNKWIVLDDGSNIYTTYAELNLNSENDESKYHFATPEKEDDSTNEIIWENGLRGVSNPVINYSKTLSDAQRNEFKSIFNWNSFKSINLNVLGNEAWNDGWYLTRQLSFQYNFYHDSSVNLVNLKPLANGDYTWLDPSGYSSGLGYLYRTYSKLNANAAGFEYKTRKEMSNFDSESQVNFRTVELNKYENYNFTILKGWKPGKGEVAINEQFARKNNLGVGDQLKIVNASFAITAIASDALSYLPGQDIDVPIPNAKASSFVFADSNTIQLINEATMTAASVQPDQIIQNWIYFLYDNKTNSLSRDLRFKEYLALSSDSQSNLYENYKSAKEYVNNGEITYSPVSHKEYTPFSDSKYRYSYTVEPLVMKTYDAVVYTICAVIAVVAMCALVVSVKKTVDFNSKQIGILKALGESPYGVSISYISYSLIISIIVVPVAWILGIVAQIPFGNLFENYFSIIPNGLAWDWVSFVISFFAIGIMSCLIAYISAFILTRRPILNILNSSVKWGHLKLIDWIKNKPLKKAPFNVRFSLTLTSSGSRQIVLMSIIMLISSFLMTLSLAAPSVVARVNSTYYKAIKYSNKYEEIPMIGNAPLSKNAISYWDGQEYADEQFVAKNKIVKDGYYKDPSVYTGSINNSSLLSPYIFDKENNKISDTYVYFINRLANQEFIPLLGNMVGNNMLTDNGTALSMGMIDAIYGVILHSLDNLVDETNTNIYSDEDKTNQTEKLSETLTSSLPQILEVIYKAISPTFAGQLSGSTWKEQILSVLYGSLPSFVRNYVEKSPSRQDQYAIAFQNELFIPGQETLATQVTNDSQIARGEKKSVSLTGLDKNQNSIVIDNDDKNKVFLSAKDKKTIMNILNCPVGNSGILNKDYFGEDSGIKLYDGHTHTLTIPTLPNNQAQSAYDFTNGNVLDNWNNNLSELQVKSKDGSYYFNLPSEAWLYDDSDFVKSVAKKDTSSLLAKAYGGVSPYIDKNSAYSSKDPNKYWTYDVSADGRYYLDPSKLNNGKLTYTDEFDKTNDLNNQAIMFKEFKYDDNGVPIGTYMRPYYQYKNMKLLIPEGWIDKSKILWNDGYKHTIDNKETHNWYKSISAENIPQSVKDAYSKLQLANSDKLDNKSLSGSWIEINPYDVSYFSDKAIESGISYLITSPSYWYRYIRTADSQFRVNTNVDSLTYLREHGAPKDLKINLEAVGKVNSYSDKLMVIDSDLANALLGYSTSRAYQYNYQTFDRSTEVKAGETKNTSDSNSSAVSSVDRWKAYTEDDLSDDSFLTNIWGNDKSKEDKDVWHPSFYKLNNNENILDYAPHNFYNEKLSNIEEPLNLSSQISFTTSMRTGQYSIVLGNNSDGYNLSMISSQELLSTIRGLTQEIATLAIAIGTMLVIAVIITAALLTMMTGDIYISQYKRFMVLLRALGYSNWSVVTYTFGTVTIMSLAAWVLGTFVAWMAIFGGVKALWAAGFAIPIGISWWPIMLSFAILGIAYVGSLIVSSSSSRHVNPSLVLTATAE